MVKKIDFLKLELSRGWAFPLKERLANFLFKNFRTKNFFEGIILTKNDFLIHVNTKSFIEYKIFTEGAYELDLSKIITNYLTEGDIAFDIGTNIGIHTIPMAKKIGNSGKVFSFEPVGFIVDKLEKNLLLNTISNVAVVPKALSNVNSDFTSNFGADAGNQGTFSLSFRDEGSTTIKTIVGDEFVKENDIQSLKLMKVDVEGFELNVFLGLRETIAVLNPIIIFEYDTNYISRANHKSNDYDAFFGGLNYQLYKIDKFIVTPLLTFGPINGMAEILAMPNRQFTPYKYK
ncbi:MAG: FkbM family methyltransferase [Cytophagales bacterium]